MEKKIEFTLKEFWKFCNEISDTSDLHPEEFLPSKYFEVWEDAEEERQEAIERKLLGNFSLEELRELQEYSRTGDLADMIYCRIQRIKEDG